MSRKYANLTDTPLFTKYPDPFRERRGCGNLRPKTALPACPIDFHRPFDDSLLSFCWLGHSSVFLHMHGKNVLIDPIFSRFSSPVPFIGPRRFPGKYPVPSDFPAIDLVLITHNHYDHMDKQTICALDPQVTQYIVPLGLGQILQKFSIQPGKITELNWYEERNIDGLRVICTPSQHNSARTLWDRNNSLWCSFFLKDDTFTVFDTGDGGFGAHFQDFRHRYGQPDLGIMECGQYGEGWHGVHMFPEESVEVCRILQSRLSIPVHWGAYVLSDHPWDDPPKRFQQRADELKLPYHIPKLYEWVLIEPGKGYENDL